MKKTLFLLCLCVIFNISAVSAATNTVKVLDIETSSVIQKKKISSRFDKDAATVIHAIKGITVQANPLPNQGYLIKIPLTKAIKVKNKWFDDIVSEVMIVYNPDSKKQGKLILYNDENTPVFFDIDYDFSSLLKTLEVDSSES